MQVENSKILKLVEDSFEVAHELVTIQQKLDSANKGILSIFKKIDFKENSKNALLIKQKICELKEKISKELKDHEKTDILLYLNEYINAIFKAAELFLEKSILLSMKAKNARKVSWNYFNKISKEEWAALQECQIIGDKLTEVYHIIRS